MPQPRHLERAPITEAIIDIRVKARKGFDAQEFSALKSELADRFPDVQPRRGGKVTLQFTPKGPESPGFEDFGLQGYFYRSKDEKLIAQFRVDGFTLNRLKPYTSWEELLPIAMELWALYLHIAAPPVITRVALRYINHIHMPPDLPDLDVYLRAAPPIPQELPQFISAFFSRVTIHDHETHLAAHVTQALEVAATDQPVTLILDIDAFCDVDMTPGDPDLEPLLGQLQRFKNLIFFSYLTDEALRRFE